MLTENYNLDEAFVFLQNLYNLRKNVRNLHCGYAEIIKLIGDLTTFLCSLFYLGLDHLHVRLYTLPKYFDVN